MNKEEIIEKINEFLVEEFEVEPEKITPDAVLKDTLGFDSLDYIDLVVVIESNFHFIFLLNGKSIILNSE